MNIKPSNIVTDKNRTYSLKEDNSNIADEFVTGLTVDASNDVNGKPKQLQDLPLHSDNRQYKKPNVTKICEDCTNGQLCKFKDIALRNILKINQTVQECEVFEEPDLIAVNYNCKYYKNNSAYRNKSTR